MQIVETRDSDIDDLLSVHRAAFDSDEEAELVRDLLDDPTAEPRLSLLAREGTRAVGHVLFTAARLARPADPVPAAILAPLAVVPEDQGRSIGGALIERGLALLRDRGVDLVFVLGHPGYYPRHGFEPAGRLGFDSPFPIPEEVADAWMVHALRPEALTTRGTVVCAVPLNQPELWSE